VRIANILTAIVRATATVAHTLGRIATNVGNHTTVAAYLAAAGAPAEWIARWGSAFGRHAAKSYRITTGAEPLKNWAWNAKGNLARHMAYATPAPLDTALTHYRAHKVAGPLLLAA